MCSLRLSIVTPSPFGCLLCGRHLAGRNDKILESAMVAYSSPQEGANFPIASPLAPHVTASAHVDDNMGHTH